MKKTIPDLVIADINMPVMDGMELLAILRDRFPDLPVLGLSGYVAAADAERLGFDDFLAKPISFTMLETQVKEKLKMT